MTVVADLLAGDIVDAADIARVIGTSTRSVARWQAGEVSPRRQAGAAARAEVSPGTRPTCARRGSARPGLHAPLPELDYVKPLDLIAAGQWRRVVDVLLAFAEGVTA